MDLLEPPAMEQLQQGGERLKEAEQGGHWGAFVQALRELDPAFEELTNWVTASWDDLPFPLQDRLIRLRDTFDAVMERALVSDSAPDVFRKAIRLFKMGWTAAHEKRPLHPLMSQLRFSAAVTMALEYERKRRDAIDYALEHDPRIREEISRAEASYNAGEAVPFDREEILRRFQST